MNYSPPLFDDVSDPALFTCSRMGSSQCLHSDETVVLTERVLLFMLAGCLLNTLAFWEGEGGMTHRQDTQLFTHTHTLVQAVIHTHKHKYPQSLRYFFSY